MHLEDPHNFDLPSSPVAIESVRITLDLYRNGKSGIQYAKLQQFSQPILSHYQIELGVSFADQVTQNNLEDMTLLLDVLETATILWEYCSLNQATKPMAFNNLKESLLGPHPSREELAQFPILVAAMEEKWSQLFEGEASPNGHAIAAGPVAHPLDAPFVSTNGTAHYGPEKLDLPEAFALFARPLLDNEALYEDPESLDDAMTKAQAYWDLAHLPQDQIDQQIGGIANTYSTSSFSPDLVKKEALQMVLRFHELFPEHK